MVLLQIVRIYGEYTRYFLVYVIAQMNYVICNPSLNS